VFRVRRVGQQAALGGVARQRRFTTQRFCIHASALHVSFEKEVGKMEGWLCWDHRFIQAVVGRPARRPRAATTVYCRYGGHHTAK